MVVGTILCASYWSAWSANEDDVISLGISEVEGDIRCEFASSVGVSLGIERVFAIMEQNQKDDKQLIRASETQVLVSILVHDMPLAVEMVSMCWNAKLKAEFKFHKRWDKHVAYAEESGIPWMVIVGDCVVEEGMVKIKDIEAKVDHKVPTSSFLNELIRLMNTPRPILPEKLP